MTQAADTTFIAPDPWTTPAAELLRAAARSLQGRARREASAETTTWSTAAQTWRRTNGRFAERNFSELSVQSGSASAIRCVLPDGLRHTGWSGLGGRPGDAGDPSPGPVAAADGPDWMETTAIRRVLERIDQEARDQHATIEHVTIDFDLTQQDAVYGTESGLRPEARVLTYLTIRVIAKRDGRVATGFYTPGSNVRLEDLDVDGLGREAATRAVQGLDARAAPIGDFPIVVSGGRGIVMLHEACCHPLEGDEVLRGSVYADAIGTQIASPIVSIVDDPTVPGAVGSYGHDDEGEPASTTPLIEAGEMTGFLTDAETAAHLGRRSSGNGRCENALYPPLPRMSNTCLANGSSDVADIIGSTPMGIYAQHVGGGEVIESTGDFTFRITNGYVIRDGELAEPIEETTVTGNGIQVLRDIDAVGNDSTVGAARCGKFGQWVPVGVVGPTLRVASLFVGGTV